MTVILKYHFLERELIDNSVFPLAWLIEICHFITDDLDKFLSSPQLVMDYVM